MKRKRVVVLGGGFGGLAAAQALDSTATEVIIVDQKNHHLFQPLLYQVATSGLAAPDIAQPIRCLVRHKPNVVTYMDQVTRIELAHNRVVCLEQVHDYDYLIVALGVQTGYFGNDQWSKFAHGLKTLEDALQIRNEVLKALEKAEMETDLSLQRELMTMVVVGGGPTGAEMAGALAELGRLVLTKNFRHIDPAQIRVVLIEASPRLLSSFPQKLSEAALRQIKELGVEVRLNTKVKEIRANKVILETEEIPASTIVWAAGVEAVSLTKTLGVPTDRAGRIKVEPDCSLPGYSRVFAIGDCAHLIDRHGVHVPGVSPAAIQMGKYVARLINQESVTTVKGSGAREAFAYLDKGSMATIGRSRAIAKIGPLEFSGKLAWLAWLLVHLLFLIGFRNKIGVLIDWTYSYFTFKRGSRIIVD